MGGRGGKVVGADHGRSTASGPGGEHVRGKPRKKLKNGGRGQSKGRKGGSKIPPKRLTGVRAPCELTLPGESLNLNKREEQKKKEDMRLLEGPAKR